MIFRYNSIQIPNIKIFFPPFWASFEVFARQEEDNFSANYDIGGALMPNQNSNHMLSKSCMSDMASLDKKICC